MLTDKEKINPHVPIDQWHELERRLEIMSWGASDSAPVKPTLSVEE